MAKVSIASSSRRYWPLFSRLKSRRKELVRSILRIQIGHQVGDIAERRQSAVARILHRCGRHGIGNLHFEGQYFLGRHSSQQNANCVGNGQAHGGERLGGFCFGPLVNANVNHFCRCHIHLSYIVSHVDMKVKPARGEAHSSYKARRAGRPATGLTRTCRGALSSEEITQKRTVCGRLVWLQTCPPRLSTVCCPNSKPHATA